jgi:hypothetical protein
MPVCVDNSEKLFASTLDHADLREKKTLAARRYNLAA